VTVKRIECPNGCIDPRTKQPKFHTLDADGKYNCPKAPGTPPEPAPAPKPATAEKPKGTRVKVGTSAPGFSDKPPEVTKGGSALILTPPEEIDFIVGKERVKEAWNLGFGVVYFVHSQEADWLEVKPLPRAQFRVSENGELTIEMEPRNFYARAVTWVCKRAGAKNVEEANRLLDSVFFFSAFGGVVVALVVWHKTAFKDSPKLKRREAARKEKAKRMQVKTIDAEFTTATGPIGATA
jgi:hypothetical protein